MYIALTFDWAYTTTIQRPRNYLSLFVFVCSFRTAMWINMRVNDEPCASLISGEGMASFNNTSSFGHCSSERCEEPSVDLLEHRYITPP